MQVGWRGRGARAGAVGVALVVVALVAGCARTVAPSAVPASPQGGSGGSSAPRTPQSPQEKLRAVSPELVEDMNSAVRATNQYWTAHWNDFFTSSYTSPKVFGLYDGTRPQDGPTCGGEPPLADNAFYCATGEDYLAFDVNLVARGKDIGDGWVYLIVAHEWGHAIQFRLSRELQTPAAELQADCFAAAALYGAARDGVITFEDGDEKEISSGLIEVADETPFTNEGDHGDAFQRIQAFAQGRAGGVQGCLPMSGG